jgi:hypothetical protein
MSDNYTLWMAQELKKLIDQIASGENPDSESFLQQVGEVQRGLEYGRNAPGSINDLLLRMGQNFIDYLRVYKKQRRRARPPGVPPGGQPTILTGGGGPSTTPPPGFPTEGSTSSDTLPGHSEETATFDVDELKGALESRKKKKVESNMKGSLDLLKDYDEE